MKAGEAPLDGSWAVRQGHVDMYKASNFSTSTCHAPCVNNTHLAEAARGARKAAGKLQNPRSWRLLPVAAPAQ